MGRETDRLLETAGRMVDAAAQTTTKLVAAGKEKVDVATLQARLSRVQKQLGMLTYTLHKTDSKNEALVEKYIREIDRIKLQLAEYEAPKEAGNSK